MKLSEAILLGSTIMAPKAGTQHRDTPEGQAGCALGMAAVGKGWGFISGTTAKIEKGESWRTVGTAAIWGIWVQAKVERPCECWLFIPRKMQVQEIIAHLFDRHVMGKKNWTLDQLVKWVQSVEPQEPEEQVVTLATNSEQNGGGVPIISCSGGKS